jgi:hypothetical protein
MDTAWNTYPRSGAIYPISNIGHNPTTLHHLPSNWTRHGTPTSAFALSSGVFYTVSTLYFTLVIGLGATTVGLGLGIAGGAGVLASYASGWLADRVGAHRVQSARRVWKPFGYARRYLMARMELVARDVGRRYGPYRHTPR